MDTVCEESRGGTSLLKETAALADGLNTVAVSSGFEFTVPGQAVPWARAGGGMNTPRFTPAKQRSYAGVLKLYCQRAMSASRVSMLEGPVELHVLAVYAWPKSLSARKRALPGAEWKTSKPDADNLVKIIKDALNKIAWRDDAQVASGHVWKKFGDVPRLTVRIRSLACGS